MKKLLFYLLVLFIYVDVHAQTSLDAVLQGTIINAKSNYIEIKYLNNPLDDSLSSITVDLNEKGQFYFELPIKRPLDAQIHLNNQYVSFYIEPSERLEVSILADDVMRSASFTADVYNNLFLIEYRKKYERARNVNDRNKHLINDDADAYTKYEDVLALDQLKFLSDFQKEFKLSKTFVKRQIAVIKYGAANRKYKFKSSAKTLANIDKELPANYYSFVDSFTVDDNNLITVPEFYEFLEYRFDYHLKNLPYKATNEFEEVSYIYNTAHSIYKDRVQNIFLTKKFGEILDKYSYQYSSRYISNFMSTVYTSEYRAYIDKKIEKARLKN
jgi:hypothetical protein